MDKTVPKAIFMFGYSTADHDKVMAWIKANGAVLVDIRYQTYSKIPGWMGRDLADKLGRYPDGDYLHEPAWGNENFRDPSGEHKIADFEAGWNVVNHVRQTRRVLLMCGCGKPYTALGTPSCHRGTVADMIAASKTFTGTGGPTTPLRVGEMDDLFRRAKPEAGQQKDFVF
jgi:hypothetical protein